MGRPHTISDTTQQPESQRPTKRRCRRIGGNWTRSGCLTCKRRRKRCDEAKPSCHSCARLGLTCEGYGSMWAAPLGPAAQVFQYTKPAQHRRPSLSPTPSISSTTSSLGQAPSVAGRGPIISPPLTEQDDIAEPNSYSPSSVPGNNNQLAVASPSPSRFISHLSSLDTHYLQYHMERGSKLLANLEIDENPLRSLLMPRALLSPILMNALCALSAIHFSNRAHNSWSAENEGANYYIHTMRGLRRTLTRCPTSFPDEAILAVALLCKYEITRGSVKQWAVHLDALQTLVTSRGGLTQLDQETAEFIRGLFVYANNVAKITKRRVIKPSNPDFDKLSPRKLDIYIGYTEEILKACARIADLPRLSSNPLALELELNTIDTILRTWTSSQTTYIIPKGISEATLSRLCVVADCFHDAAYIYLHSTLERIALSLSPSIPPPLTPSHSSSSLNAPWATLVSVPKHLAISNLLDRIKSHPIDNNCEFSALTFPLFIAGCETTARTDKGLILQTLSTLEVNFGIGNVKRAKELLAILWAGDGDDRKHWMDVLEGLGWDLNLA
ncbi:fungal-specific transcription factor domain-containing protein [Aspergillus aurantiobrunneus]